MQPFSFFVRNPQDFSTAAGKKIPVMPEGSLLASSRRESMGILRSFFLLLPAIIFYAKSIIEGKKADDISYQEGKYQEEMTQTVEQKDTSLHQALGWDQRTALAFKVGHRFPTRPEANHISPVTSHCFIGSLQDKTEC